MFTKSLLLGSAAALVAVSGARAADAVIIPEPEAVEYVRVCDAAGTGYFYIPGTETCLKISGYVRHQINFDTEDYAQGGTGNWTYQNSSASLTAASWTDSEYGPVTTSFTMLSEFNGNSFAMDAAKLSVAGISMGYFGGFLDNGINGETDDNHLRNKFSTIQYTGTAGAISFGASIDQIYGDLANKWDGAKFGVTGMIGFTSGAVAATVVGYYDVGAELGGVVARVSADVGPGTLQGRFSWAQDGISGYTGTGFGDISLDDGTNAQWVAEASYAAKLGDKLTLTPGFSWTQYYGNGGISNAQDRLYRAGLTADYALTSTLAIKGSVQYWNFRDGYRAVSPDDATGWNTFLRFQASF